MLEWLLVHGSLIAFFILANSFFVAAEFALVSVRETRIEQLIAANKPGARTVLHLKHHLDEFLPAVQLGVTLAALALGGLGEPALRRGCCMNFRKSSGFLSCSRRVVCARRGDRSGVRVDYVLRGGAGRAGAEVTGAAAGGADCAGGGRAGGCVSCGCRGRRCTLMNVSARVVLRVFRAPLRGEVAAHSPEELKMMATATRRMGLLPTFQEEMIHRAIELKDVMVSEIMTPRGKIFSLPADMSLEAGERADRGGAAYARAGVRPGEGARPHHRRGVREGCGAADALPERGAVDGEHSGDRG